MGLESDIYCFNVESVPELDNIDALAASYGKTASIALRINPNIDAHTHHYITTGLSENKFGISLVHLDSVLDHLETLKCPTYRIAFSHWFADYRYGFVQRSLCSN